MLDAFTTISGNLRDKLSKSTAVPEFNGLRITSTKYTFACWIVPSHSEAGKTYFVQQHLEQQSVDGTGLLSFKYSCECMASSTKHCCIHCLEVRREAEKSFNYFVSMMISNLKVDHTPLEKTRSEFEQRLDQKLLERRAAA